VQAQQQEQQHPVSLAYFTLAPKLLLEDRAILLTKAKNVLQSSKNAIVCRVSKLRVRMLLKAAEKEPLVLPVTTGIK